MKCDRCGSGEHKVIDSREYGTHKRRVRKCLACGNPRATVEVWEDVYGSPGEVEHYVKEVLVTRGDA